MTFSELRCRWRSAFRPCPVTTFLCLRLRSLFASTLDSPSRYGHEHVAILLDRYCVSLIELDSDGMLHRCQDTGKYYY